MAAMPFFWSNSVLPNFNYRLVRNFHVFILFISPAIGDWRILINITSWMASDRRSVRIVHWSIRIVRLLCPASWSHCLRLDISEGAAAPVDGEGRLINSAGVCAVLSLPKCPLWSLSDKFTILRTSPRLLLRPVITRSCIRKIKNESTRCTGADNLLIPYSNERRFYSASLMSTFHSTCYLW